MNGREARFPYLKIIYCDLSISWLIQALQNDYHPFDPSHREMLATSQESIIHPLHHCYDYIAPEDMTYCQIKSDQSDQSCTSSAALCSAQLNSNNTVSTVDFDLPLSSGMVVEIGGEGSGDPVTIVVTSRDRAVLVRGDGVAMDSSGQPCNVSLASHVDSTQHNIESKMACSDCRDLPLTSSPDTNTDVQTAYVSNSSPLERFCPLPPDLTDSNTDELEEVGMTCIQDNFSSIPRGSCQFVTDSGISTEYVHTETPL